MKKWRIIIAIGGNAIHDRFSDFDKAMECIADIVADKNNEVIITHGNGPQVGELIKHLNMPMHLCGAMSQSEIGYLIQQGLGNALRKKNINKNIATIVTQITIDKNSTDFKNPTKPIGGFYNKSEADKIAKIKRHVFKEDSGRGWRRVVPSPEPLKIIELNAIKNLLDGNHVVICSGGGGIPVVENNGQLLGVDAVIDKDKTAALLGHHLNADFLIILTTIEKAYLNYGKKNQMPINKLNLKTAKRYLKEGHFAEGSMKPKIEAAISFIGKNKNRKVFITNAKKLNETLVAKNGTLIVY